MSTNLSPYRRFPADAEDWFPAEQIAKGKAYSRPLRRLGAIKGALSKTALVLLTGTHAIPNLLGEQRNWVVRLFVALAVVSIVEQLVSLPFAAHRELRYDKQWGFSNQTARGFIIDLSKGLPLGIVLNALLMLPLWAAIRATDAWWLIGWVIFSVFSVGFVILFPVVFAPIFNKYTPLDDGELRTDLLALAAQAGANIDEILVEDSSRRDTRDNAFVAGLGKTRRLVIYDNMIGKDPRHLRSVAAHEIGHWKLKHIARSIPLALGLALTNFVVLKVVLESGWVARNAGVDSLHDPAIYPVFALVFPLASVLTQLPNAWLSRAHERDADLFSLGVTNDPDGFIEAFRALATDNVADVDPPRWLQLVRSHPTLPERMAMGRSWSGGGGASVEPD